MRYTRSHPMPDPLVEAMSSLLRAGARIPPDGAYADEGGHHLFAWKGTLAIRVRLALDYHADGVAWADGDLSWQIEDDGQPVSLKKWSEVHQAFTQADNVP